MPACLLPLLLLALTPLASPAAGSTVRWEPFELGAGAAPLVAELGRVTVPLRRDEPAAGSVELAFVRLRAPGRKRSAPVVYLAGGPGGSGIGAARNPYAWPSLKRLAESSDVILLDQRGIGASTPRAVCAPKPRAPADRFGPRATALSRLIEETRACVAEWAAKDVDVRGFTVAESAADLEDLRAALGVPKISLLAHSYGTHLALAAIRAYPQSIERAVLISTAGPNHMRKLPLVLDTQLEKLSLLARRDPSIGADVPDMAALLRRVLARLEKEPMLVTVTDRATGENVEVPISADALRGLLALDIGDGNDFTFFPALLLTIDRGDPSLLAWFVEKRYPLASVNLMAFGMRCSAGATVQRDQLIAVDEERSIFGHAQNGPYPEICAALPASMDLGDAYRAPLISDVPVLFISGTLDSNTPPYQAEEVRWGMPNASHLIVANAGHENLEPSDEVQRVIADYLAGKDVSARSVSLPPPDFRSVEEAKRERKRETSDER